MRYRNLSIMDRKFEEYLEEGSYHEAYFRALRVQNLEQLKELKKRLKKEIKEPDVKNALWVASWTELLSWVKEEIKELEKTKGGSK